MILRKPLVVGQAPGPRSDPDHPLSGRCGVRLADLCGIKVPDFMERFDRFNLIEKFPGKSGKGDAFPMEQAYAGAVKLLVTGETNGRMVVLLGDNVAAAFGLPRGLAPFVWITGFAMLAAVCPHPSGINRWYNDPKNLKRAKRFWRAVAEDASACV